MRIEFLGTRGSIPISGAEYQKYGGASTCIRVLSGAEEIYLDAGSGIAQAVPLADTRLSILLTHLHLDHVIGLPFFAALSEAERRIDVFAPDCEERVETGIADPPSRRLTASEALRRLITPPYWPCKLWDYPAAFVVNQLTDRPSFSLGAVRISAIPARHPGGSLVYRIACGESAVVVATDFEHSDEGIAELAEFASGASLLVYDGQYTDAEYEAHRGFGHSTASVGLRVARAAGVSRLCITHHDPHHTDETLDAMESAAIALARELGMSDLEVRFARAGDIIEL